MNVELADSAINIQRLEKVEVSLREALQTEKDKVVQLRVAEVALQEAKADLQATLDEGAKRMVALREQNESLQQEKTEAEDACNRERQEIRGREVEGPRQPVERLQLNEVLVALQFRQH